MKSSVLALELVKDWVGRIEETGFDFVFGGGAFAFKREEYLFWFCPEYLSAPCL